MERSMVSTKLGLAEKKVSNYKSGGQVRENHSFGDEIGSFFKSIPYLFGAKHPKKQVAAAPATPEQFQKFKDLSAQHPDVPADQLEKESQQEGSGDLTPKSNLGGSFKDEFTKGLGAAGDAIGTATSFLKKGGHVCHDTKPSYRRT